MSDQIGPARFKTTHHMQPLSGTTGNIRPRGNARKIMQQGRELGARLEQEARARTQKPADGDDDARAARRRRKTEESNAIVAEVLGGGVALSTSGEENADG